MPKKKNLILLPVILIVVIIGGYWFYRETSFNRAIGYTVRSSNWDRDDLVILRSGNLGRFDIDYKVVLGIRILNEGEYISLTQTMADGTSIQTRSYGPFPFLVYMERNQWGIWEPIAWNDDSHGHGISIGFLTFTSGMVSQATYHYVVIPHSGFSHLDLSLIPNEMIEFITDETVILWDEITSLSITIEEHNEQLIFFLEDGNNLFLARNPDLFWDLFFSSSDANN